MHIVEVVEEKGGRRIAGTIKGRVMFALIENMASTVRPWSVGTSTVLPTNIEQAEEYVSCAKAVFDKYHKLMDSNSTQNTYQTRYAVNAGEWPRFPDGSAAHNAKITDKGVKWL